ncbi:receptor like protein 29 [Eucalyptus grandis]|uniref:receptor like protein 29 n=1 Tax=Eucalyptus grandis TaxID=71139 RepID=UPI00192EFC26|nr:receptor like protein 29 [Eucalyptus grandis]
MLSSPSLSPLLLLLFLGVLFSSLSSCYPSLPINAPPKTTAPPPPPPPSRTSTNSGPNAMLPSESETLFKIMESMSSDRNWRASYPHPCGAGSSWPGIECKPGNDKHLHVSRLNFGTLPNPTCKPTATFPYLIFSLPQIQSIFFFNCFTRTRTTLSVSPNRLLNSSLRQLGLKSNPALVGPIPPQISSLKSLEVLTLSQNRLSGLIPVQVFSLKSLIHLDLSFNLLTGTIPFQIGNLKNLVGLDLSYNSLGGSIPGTIGQLGQLQKLDFSSNLLTGRIPDTIEKLNSLVFVALSNNGLGGKFPTGVSKLQNLQCFIMENNPMGIPLPVQFGMLVKLQELRLANSRYSGTIPPSFAQLRNLSTLSLQNNQLTGEIPVGFGTLSHIYHLNLSRNLLTGVVPFDAGFLKRLGKNLDLSGNPGLCLNPTEASSVKIGVSVCKTSKNGSLIVPMKHSEAASLFLDWFFLIGVLGIPQVLFSVWF